MRELFLEQKKLIKVACYKEIKFAPHPKDTIDVVAKKRAQQDCDFGFTEITPLCKNCVWFQITDVSMNGRPLVGEKLIDRSDVSILALQYKEQDISDPENAMRIAQEKAESLKVTELE